MVRGRPDPAPRGPDPAGPVVRGAWGVDWGGSALSCLVPPNGERLLGVVLGLPGSASSLEPFWGGVGCVPPLPR